MGLKYSICKIILFSAIFCWFKLVYANNVIPPVIVTDNSNFQDTVYSIAADNSASKTITNNEIKYSNAQNLKNILQAQMGLQVNDLSGNGSRAALSLRGFGNNAFANTLILIDGIPWTTPDIADLSNIDLGIIPVEQIKKIEILPSSDSVLYGDQAVGGVVNIITKKAQPKQREVKASYGSFTSRGVNALLSDVFKNGVGYNLGLSHYDSNGYRDRNNLQNNHVNLLLSYNQSDVASFIRYLKFNQHLELPGGLTRKQVEANRKQADNNVSFSNQDTDFWQAGFNKIFANNETLKMRASLVQVTEHNALPVMHNPCFFSEHRMTANFSPEFSWLFDISSFTVKPKFGVFLQQGEYQIKYQSDSNSDLNKRQEAAVYGEVNTYLTAKFFLLLGARVARANYDLNGSPLINNNLANNATAINVALNYDAAKNAYL